MNNERLFEAVSEISERHILEFMDIKPRKKRKALRISVISAAACLLIITAVPVVHFLKKSNYEISTIAPWIDEMVPPYNMTTTPYIKINGTAYIYAGDDGDDLPDGFILIGTVTKDENVNGYSNACKLGDKIFANLDDPDNIYVYTRLFHGDKYWYVKFSKTTNNQGG